MLHEISSFPKRGGWWGLFFLPVILLSGCATYEAKPLDQAAVDAALVPPKLDSVRIAASKFEHPLLSPIVLDDRAGFSPDEIAVMVVIVSPQLRALRDQRGVAQAQVLQAGILPNPQLGYALDQPKGNIDPTLINGLNLGLSWEVTSLLGRSDRVASAQSGAKAVDLSIAWQEWQAAQDARLRAFRVLSLRERLPLVRTIESDFADTLEVFHRAAAMGHKVGGEVSLMHEAWIAAKTARLSTEQEYLTELAALNLALGQPAEMEIPLRPAPAFPELPPDTSATVLLQGLEQRRLDLVALALGYESQEASVRAAVKGQFPKIGLSFARVNDTSDVRTHTYGVTIDLPIFDRNQGNIAIAKATRQQLFDDYVARTAEARAEVVLLLGKIAAARAQLAADREEMPELEQSVAALERALQSRNADLASYRDARTMLASRRLDQATLQLQVLELGVALELATGRPLLNRTPRS